MVMLMKREANFFLLEKLAAVYGFWMREREDGGGGGGGRLGYAHLFSA